MAFVLKKDNTFWSKVKVFTPSSTRIGKHDEGIFSAKFVVMSEDELKNYDEEFDGTLLEKVFIEFKDVKDENDKEIPCNDETLKSIRDDSCAATALVSAYVHAIKTKNFKRKN